ncbi:MAG: SDR family oxidoreductase [Verrucomicrobia bacterium]|nr:SDR family oxidoreductase [Verrucomicrobiota bacterium]
MPPDATPPAPSFSLHGKVVVLAGGSGLLGRALTAAIADAGATLIITSRNRASLEPAAATARAAGRDVHAEELDIGREASIHALRDRVLATHRRLDGLVFNAVQRVMRGFNDQLANWETSMATNATGFFATVRALGDAMAAQNSGSIVNIASHMGMVGVHPALYPKEMAFPSPDYFFHKAGMLNLTRYLASYYGARGVRANVVSPGGIYNPERPPPAEFLARYGPMTALGRMADAREIGGAVVFLLSDASTYVTGANLPVDGGYTAK